jgi:hypothetical protein
MAHRVGGCAYAQYRGQQLRLTLVPILRKRALACLGVKMSKNHLAAHDSLRRQLAAVNCIAPIVDCIRKMRAEGLADNEIAGLFRQAADELDEATASKDE